MSDKIDRLAAKSTSSPDEMRHNERMRTLKGHMKGEISKRKEVRGLIIVNTGDGKGKSTAAFGMAVRALGHGYRVAIFQFIKGSWAAGEEMFLRDQSNVRFVVGGEGFPWDTADFSRDAHAARQTWRLVEDVLHQSDLQRFDIVVLDEINVALDLGYLNSKDVAETLLRRAPGTSVVLTGRNAPPEVLDIADTITLMESVRHAYDRGVAAQRGIDF